VESTVRLRRCHNTYSSPRLVGNHAAQQASFGSDFRYRSVEPMTTTAVSETLKWAHFSLLLTVTLAPAPKP
jgi:hypothetical protein